MIIINLDKAKEIHRRRIRDSREPLFSKLDTEFQRALEMGNDTSDIVKRKQELRDLTKHDDLEKATTLEEIKAFWPDYLGPKLS